jgi:hypothetical protein
MIVRLCQPIRDDSGLAGSLAPGQSGKRGQEWEKGSEPFFRHNRIESTVLLFALTPW